MKILATDVHYTESTGTASGVLFDQWAASSPAGEYSCKLANIQPYESGSFYKRELPCILALLDKHKLVVDCIVIDGYVHLDNQSKPGLGKHLFDALNGTVSVVGVAKNSFPGITDIHKLFRGKSNTPLYITTTGDLAEAKSNIADMYGDFRIPALLKRVDQLCRSDG